MVKRALCILSILFLVENPVVAAPLVFIGKPLFYTRTDRSLNICGDDPCLSHGTDILSLRVQVTEVLSGDLSTGRRAFDILDGQFWNREAVFPEPRQQLPDIEHFFIAQKHDVPGGETVYLISEVDPVSNRICTIQKIEDYLNEEVWFSINNGLDKAGNCYSIKTIRELIAARTAAD